MRVDCNGEVLEQIVDEIEVYSHEGDSLVLVVTQARDSIHFIDENQEDWLGALSSDEELDNLIKALQTAKELGWLQKPKLAYDVVDLESGED